MKYSHRVNNVYRVKGNKAYIEIDDRFICIIDKSDLTLLNGYRLFPRIQKNGVYITCKDIFNKKPTIFIHRLIMNPNKGLVVDHIDNNPLNNSKINLRVCTNNENLWNWHYSNGKSRYKGVKDRKTSWAFAYSHNGIGYEKAGFLREEFAALAYDDAITQLRGEFARTNANEYPELEKFRNRYNNIN